MFGRSSVLFLSIALFIASSPASATCNQQGAVAGKLPPPSAEEIADYGLCRRGFVCPNATGTEATMPEICPPTAECVRRRADGKLCEPQGIYEPYLCPTGHYCPKANEIVKCPAGNWCPSGAREPVGCSPLSHCPEGTRTEYFIGCLLIVAVVNTASVAGYIAYMMYRSRIATNVAGELAEGATPELVDGMKRGHPESAALMITFRDMKVTAPASRGKEKSVLLAGVSGSIPAGKVTAIMGPSGSGKSVLLKTLLDKLPGSFSLEGSLLVNGRPGKELIPKLKSSFGFVPQADVLQPRMTVEQNIRFAADMRLPSEWSAEERSDFVSTVMRSLRIAHVADVLIGDAEKRGVSGGQRKRASIGVELASAPAALFLDDPTTGLDATTAMELVRVLKIVAQEAHIPVAMVVSQPRVEIWEELDQVLLLAPGGRTAFEGSREEAVEYFRDQAGLDFSKGNPCDHIVDAIHSNGEACADAWDSVVEQHDPLLQTPMAPTESNEPRLRALASFPRQLALQFIRALQKLHADGRALLFDIVVAIVSTAILTTAGINKPFEAVFHGAYVLFSAKTDMWTPGMLCMLWLIGLAGAIAPSGVRSFAVDRLQFFRESASGYSRVAYFIGTSAAQQLRLILVTLNFAVVAYLMWAPYLSFWALWGLMYLTCLTSDAIAVLTGILLEIDAAVLLSTVILIFFALLNGFPGVPFISTASYTLWFTELIYSLDMRRVQDIYDAKQVEDGFANLYVFFRYGLDMAVLLGNIVLWRLLALAALLLWERDFHR